MWYSAGSGTSVASFMPHRGHFPGSERTNVLIHRTNPDKSESMDPELVGPGSAQRRIPRQQQANDSQSAHAVVIPPLMKSVSNQQGERGMTTIPLSPEPPLYFLAMPRIASSRTSAVGTISTLVPHDVMTTSITWNREISRIFFDRCAVLPQREGNGFFDDDVCGGASLGGRDQGRGLEPANAAMGRDEGLWGVS